MGAVYGILVGHFIADFVCQSDWMAVNKSQRWDALAWHVAVYAAVMVLMLVALVPTQEGAAVWLAVNAVAHFLQDAIASRVMSRLRSFQGGSQHWFFIALGFDQLLHYVTLFVTAGWWLR